MIRIGQPAVALHTHDVPGYKYKMQFTEVLSEDAKVHQVVGKVLVYARKAGGFLENLVLNSHGSSGTLYIGKGDRLTSGNVDLFKILRAGGRPVVGTIWIVACQVSRDAGLVGIGDYFCRQFAMAAGSYVVAADRYQYVNPGLYLRGLPDGCIDEFEGNVSRWDPNGNKESFKP